MRRSLVTALVLSAGSAATAQTPHLVTDLFTETVISQWQGRVLASDGDTAFFWADGLWKTDGTSAGTVQIIDALLGSVSLNLPQLTLTPLAIAHDGWVFLSLNNQPIEYGALCWSNGEPGDFHHAPSIRYAGTYGIADGDVYIVASTTANGLELWRFDTSAGEPVLVKDIGPGAADGLAGGNLIEYNGRLYFTANDGVNGRQVWSTDGTTAGTVMTPSPNPTGNPFSTILGATDAGVVFLANDGVHGFELWVTDGTPAGTHLVVDLNPGSESSNPASTREGKYVKHNGSIYFTLPSSGGRSDLYRTDGTAAGTVQCVTSTGPLRTPTSANLTASSCGVVGVMAIGTDAFGVFRTDGTAAGTNRLCDFTFNDMRLAPFGEGVIFSNIEATNGFEMWYTDGTAPGTRVIGTPEPGDAGGGLPGAAANGRFVYPGFDGTGDIELWVTDGTTKSQLRELKADNIGSGPNQLAAGPGGVYFQTGYWGEWLYFSDGTQAGTRLIASSAQTAVADVTGTPDAVFFNAYDDYYMTDTLWRTDGTTLGTYPIRVNDAIYGGNTLAMITPFKDGKVIGQGYLAPYNAEPCISDGTTAGTFLLADAAPGSDASNPLRFIRAGDKMYFFATAPNFGFEPWVTDGTPAGTHRIADVATGNASGMATHSSIRNGVAAVGDDMFFAGADDTGPGLFKTDGSTVELAARIGPHPASANWLAGFEGHCYFVGIPSDNSARGLWRSDGTPGGTTLVKAFPINPNSDQYRYIDSLVVANGVLYFRSRSSNPLESTELWRTDGTTSGTVKVTDLWPTSNDPPMIYAMPGGPLYFAGHRQTTGIELFRSNGTDAETLAIEVVPGAGGGFVGGGLQACVSGDTFYFCADDGVHGPEVWALGVSEMRFPPACPADFNGDAFLDFFDYDDYVLCFESGNCPPGKSADFNRDEFVDFFDYDDFVTAFETGC